MKCAGTSVRRILSDNYSGEAILHMHAPLFKLSRERLENKRVFATIRNPYYWYVSLFEHLKTSESIVHEENEEYEYMNSFQNFMEYVFFEEKRDLGPLPFFKANKCNIGLFTSTLFRSVCKRNWDSKINTRRKNFDFEDFFDKNSLVEKIFTLKNLENKLFLLFEHSNVDYEDFELPVKNSSYIQDYERYYVSDFFKKLIYYKDKFIFDRFGYDYSHFKM